MSKIRILVVGDKSTASTGFAVYKRNLLEGLYRDPRFEVAELGFVAYQEHKKLVPWRLYTTSVRKEDPSYEQYVSNPENKNGLWRWNECVLDFKPHIVVAPVDPWQTKYMVDSPLRKYYHLVTAPPIDSGPISDKNVETIMGADSVLAWTQFGKREMEKRGIRVSGVIPMGVDCDIFYPMEEGDRLNNRIHMDVPITSHVFGFVCRNQRRKRIPELMEAFRLYLERHDDDAILYIHTTYPDMDQWNLPRYLLEKGLSNKVYFTYRCHHTGEVFGSLFADKLGQSKFCGGTTGVFVDTLFHVPTSAQLNQVYNTFDTYIQCANCEGWGAPILEAAATNANVVVIQHSAMEEVGRHVGAIQVAPKCLIEINTVASYRAVIDESALADAMWEARQLPRPNTAPFVRDNFSWNNCVDPWIDYLREVGAKDRWNDPRPLTLRPQLQDEMTVPDLVESLAVPLGKSGSLSNLLKMEAIASGGYYNGSEFTQLDQNTLFGETSHFMENAMTAEGVRVGDLKLKRGEWMEDASDDV